MAIKRRASAHWQGTGKDGKGRLSTQSRALHEVGYSFGKRFGDEKGTNPEELIAAAHAGCFSMKLAFCIQEAGLEAQKIDTDAVVILDNGKIGQIELSVKVHANGLSQEKFEELLGDAARNCPISQLFNADIRVSGELEA